MLLEAGDVPEFPFALVAKTVYVWAVPCSWLTSTVVLAVVPVLLSDDAQV
jgi:hypothetical protein